MDLKSLLARAEALVREQNILPDRRYRFVGEALEILTDIHRTIAATEHPTSTHDALGVRDLRLVHTLLEVIISWGIYPCLLPGVGVPLSKRTRSGYVQRSAPAEADPLRQEGRGTEGSPRRLWRLMRGLCELAVVTEGEVGEGKRATAFTSVSSVVVTRHLTDLYAGLLQLAYAPVGGAGNKGKVENTDFDANYNREKERKATLVGDPEVIGPGNIGGLATATVGGTETIIGITGIDPGVDYHDVDDRLLTVAEREEAEQLFQDVFSRSDPYRALESLTLLLGTSPLHPTPRWLRSVCGRHLSRILLRPSGVQVVLEFMCGGGGGGGETGDGEVNLAQMERMAKVVLSVPFQVQSLEEYYTIICPQLITIIQRSIQSTASTPTATPIATTLPIPTPTVVQSTTFILTRLIHRHPILARTLVIEPIVGPLSLYTSPPTLITTSSFTSSLDLDPVLISEHDFNLLLRTLHAFLVGNEPSPQLLQSFIGDAVVPLYHAYAFACRSRSGVRETVHDVVNVYLRIVETKDAVEALKRIVFGAAERMAGRVGEAYFAMGEGGGVALRQRRTMYVAPPTELQLDVDTFVEFLHGVGNKDLAGDLFVIVLNEYSSVKAGAALGSTTGRANPKL
ncbi:hypothetical protein BC936DRAFT_138319 [Jimgerdemannia flammicorona]|uniref:Uncharacterized protein n=1 Tax=Jimgerdemannia flammicorona TaxID=994334 RepID=A0A433CQN1_9FUNG|nr:hypothetical protein BC936DRAFT_138319 [Jimgerdemannia flammicorona]